MNNALRTIILWVCLIAMFALFYRFYATPSGESGNQQQGAPMLIAWVPVVAIMLFVGLFFFFFRGIQEGGALNQEGVTLIHQGRYSEALAKFQQALPKLRGQAPLAHYNIGLARLALWQPREAEKSFDDALQKKRISIPKLANLIIPSRALARALQGKLDSAQTDLEEAGRLGAEATASALVAAGVIAARRAEWRRAADLLGRYEVKQLGGTTRGLADALLAWAAQELTGEKRNLDLVALYGETGPETVRQVWPELVAFLNAPR